MNDICNQTHCEIFSTFIVFFSFIFSIIEIEIEGKYGWAKNLPTVHLTKNPKSLTFYHVYIFLFVLSAFNMIFFIRTELLNWSNWLYIFSMTLMFFFLEDMYWFFANPFHSITEKNEWHIYWGPIPMLYIVLPTSAFLLSLLGGYKTTFLWNLLVFFIGSIVVFGLSRLYRRFYTRTHPDVVITKICCENGD